MVHKHEVISISGVTYFCGIKNWSLATMSSKGTFVLVFSKWF